MAALSKHRGGDKDRERPECVHSPAIQTGLKPTGAEAFSQLRFSLVGPLPPTELPFVNLPHCFPISSSTFIFFFKPLFFTFTFLGLPQQEANTKGS